MSLGRDTFEVPVTIPPPVENAIYDFEADTQGWVAGAGVDSVDRVTSFANGPGTPRGGLGALEAATSPAPATTPRVISVTPEEPIDLSDAKSVYLWMNSYGVPGATGYLATITLTGADGTTVTAEDITPTSDVWNEISIDVSQWESRSAVTSIDVSFAAIGSTYPTWNPKFQIDDLGYFTN